MTAAAARHAAAERQRLYRQRQRRGERIIGVRVSNEVILALLTRGMSDQDSRRRAKVAAELSEILETWAAQWVH